MEQFVASKGNWKKLPLEKILKASKDSFKV